MGRDNENKGASSSAVNKPKPSGVDKPSGGNVQARLAALVGKENAGDGQNAGKDKPPSAKANAVLEKLEEKKKKEALIKKAAEEAAEAQAAEHLENARRLREQMEEAERLALLDAEMDARTELAEMEEILAKLKTLKLLTIDGETKEAMLGRIQAAETAHLESNRELLIARVNELGLKVNDGDSLEELMRRICDNEKSLGVEHKVFYPENTEGTSGALAGFRALWVREEDEPKMDDVGTKDDAKDMSDKIDNDTNKDPIGVSSAWVTSFLVTVGIYFDLIVGDILGNFCSPGGSQMGPRVEVHEN